MLGILLQFLGYIHNKQTICCFILMHPVVFSYTKNKLKYAVQYNTLMSYHTVLQVSARMKHRQALLFITN